MAKPGTSPYDWATDANYAAGSDPWSGQPTKVAPAGAKQATGFVPETAASATEFNAILSNFSLWLTYLEELATAAAGEVINIAPITGVQGVLSISDWDLAVGSSGPDVESAADGSRLVFDLTSYLPLGAVITEVDVLASEGASGRSLGSRQSVYINVSEPNYITPAAPSVTQYYSETDGSTTAVRAFAISDGVNAGTAWPGAGVTIEAGKNYQLSVQAGTDGGVHVSDNIYGIRVVFTHPGIEQVS